jgi:hypothetical protein
MSWKFDQAPNVACITSQSVLAGESVLVASHYEDDHSWAFLDGLIFDPAKAVVVAMTTVLDLHPELQGIADTPPGWTAKRPAVGLPWSIQQDHWESDT